MSEPRDPRSIIDQAEQAAAAGDYASAEQRLREAAFLQEASLGPLHPDLANTLNNLGVVCERTGKPVDAEDCFRRAFVIATTALAPDHPFVATSQQNLRDFCEAHGKPFDVVAPPSEATAPLEEPATTAAADVLPESPSHDERPDVTPEAVKSEEPAAAPADPPSESTSRDESPDVEPETVTFEEPVASADAPRETPLLVESQDVNPAPKRSIAPLTIGSLTAGAVLIAILATARPWLNTTGRSASSPEIAIAAAQDTPVATPLKEAAVSAPPTRQAPEPGTSPTAPKKITESHADGVRASRMAAPGAERPTLVKARLCADLEEWRCDPPDLPVPPGILFFYTQVKSSSPTTVTHRWYRGSRLYQSVDIRVQPSPGAGFRTYSRHTMTTESAGSWRVELTARDGTVLHEERFSVR